MNNLLSSGDQFLALIKQIVEENIDNENFSVEDLADSAGISQSVLLRKLARLTGKSTSEFISDIRITRAKELLENDVATVSEIAYRVGFRSPSYFIKVFKKKYKISPGDFRKGVEGNSELSRVARKPEYQTFAFRRRYRDIVKGVSILLVIVIVAGAVYFLSGFKGQSEREKSIAVLPFINDTPEETEMYFINGTMESILNNLAKIEDLRVVSRTSVEQYRDNPRPVKEISREMNVRYILEGSGQKYGNRFRLSLQLIDALDDRHIWSDEFDMEIRDIEELFALQSETAQLVATELKAKITPEEKQRIEKIPTDNQTAYDLYIKARELHAKDPTRAIALNRLSLEYDSTFSGAYGALAEIYQTLYYRNPLEFPTYIDSTLHYANKAIAFDDQNEHAYIQRGSYYRAIVKAKLAIAEYDKAIEINKNCAAAYQAKGWLYFTENDFLRSIESFHKAIQLDKGSQGVVYVRHLGYAYMQAGFPEKYVDLLHEAFELDGDSLSHYKGLRTASFVSGNYEEAVYASQIVYSLDTTDLDAQASLGNVYFYNRQFSESLEYYTRYLHKMEESGRFNPFHIRRIAYLFKLMGDPEKSEYYTNRLADYYETYQNSPYEFNLLYRAEIHMLKGDIEGVYNLLSKLADQKRLTIYCMKLNHNPIYNQISAEPEFLQIIGNIEEKYKSQLERDRQWLEENDML
jgi:TolB-like protein/AraC-like DNA-binding protein